MLRAQAQHHARRRSGCAWSAAGQRVPVRRAAPADPRRAQRRRARHPGVRAAPLRPRAAQPRRAAGRRLHATTRPTRRAAMIQRDSTASRPASWSPSPTPWILYATLAKGPKLGLDEQRNSTRHFMRELNRLGITGAIDAGGGFQNYPERLRRSSRSSRAAGELTVRIAYNLFTQKPGQRAGGLPASGPRHVQARPTATTIYRLNGAGEMLVFSAADFEDFLEPRPDLPPTWRRAWRAWCAHLAANRWPFRLHATLRRVDLAHARRVRDA